MVKVKSKSFPLKSRRNSFSITPTLHAKQTRHRLLMEIWAKQKTQTTNTTKQERLCFFFLIFQLSYTKGFYRSPFGCKDLQISLLTISGPKLTNGGKIWILWVLLNLVGQFMLISLVILKFRHCFHVNQLVVFLQVLSLRPWFNLCHASKRGKLLSLVNI